MSETTHQDTTPARPYRTARQKVPPFARYEGTSAWRKDRRRVRAYARFRAAEKAKQTQTA